MKDSIPYRPVTLREKERVAEIYRAALRRKLAKEALDGMDGSGLPETASPKAKIKKA
ncbi:hypothetical protein BAC1_01597 [uncultured bacterium]|nr:hypothetical protein BAC1_01597 [uncultured bacterium]